MKKGKFLSAGVPIILALTIIVPPTVIAIIERGGGSEKEQESSFDDEVLHEPTAGANVFAAKACPKLQNYRFKLQGFTIENYHETGASLWHISTTLNVGNVKYSLIGFVKKISDTLNDDAANIEIVLESSKKDYEALKNVQPNTYNITDLSIKHGQTQLLSPSNDYSVLFEPKVILDITKNIEKPVTTSTAQTDVGSGDENGILVNSSSWPSYYYEKGGFHFQNPSGWTGGNTTAQLFHLQGSIKCYFRLYFRFQEVGDGLNPLVGQFKDNNGKVLWEVTGIDDGEDPVVYAKKSS